MKSLSLEEIRKELRRGEYKVIQQMVSCSYSAINQHFIGERNPDTQTGKRITEAAIQVIQKRKELIKDFKK